MWGNEDAGVQIIEASDPLVQRNQLRKQALADLLLKPMAAERENPHEKVAKHGARHKDIAPLWVHSGGKGDVRDNEIYESDWHGVAIGSQATPLLQRNRIHHNRKSGVFIEDGAAPFLLENDVHHNWVGVEVIEHAEPTLRGNKIHHMRLGGLWVYKEARGLYEGNEICHNAKAGVRVWALGDPTLQGNKIHSGKTCGVLVYECGKGHFVDNDIYNHKEWNVEVKRFATPLFEKNRSSGAHMGGVYCHGGGGIGAFTSDFTNRDSAITRFTLQNNDIYANFGVGVSIGNDGVPVIKGNRFYGGQTAAIYVAGDKAQGTITDNEIYENKDGIVLREGAMPHVERNSIHHQTRRGVIVCAKGQGMFVENEISHSGTYNVEVRGEKPKVVPSGLAALELERKKKLYAAMGLLVPLPKNGVTIAGLLTDESGRTSVHFRHNRLVGGGLGSVYLADYSKGYLKGNSISECSGSGVVVGVGADPEVSDNAISMCAQYGLHVHPGGRGRFQANKISQSASAGVCIEAEATSDLRANDIFDNDDQGLLIRTGALCRVTANTMRGNGTSGIEVDGESLCQLRDNDLYGNKGCGLLVRAASEVVVANNEMRENGSAGVLLVEGANPLLAKNLVRHNGTNGVRCESGAKGRLERNVIEENGASGIYAELGCGPTIGENCVQHNEDEEGAINVTGTVPTADDEEAAAAGLGALADAMRVAKLAADAEAAAQEAAIHRERAERAMVAPEEPAEPFELQKLKEQRRAARLALKAKEAADAAIAS